MKQNAAPVMPSRLRRVARIALIAAGIAAPAGAACNGVAVNVLTSKYDQYRTAANPNECLLTTADVNAASFGKLGSYAVSGNIYAQPLYVEGLGIGGVSYDVLFVATMNDVVYAFDASHPGAPPLWVRDFRVNGVTNAPDLYGADLGAGLGIVSTPVIVAATNTMYLVSTTLENGQNVFRLRALDTRTGQDVHASAPIAASYGGVSIDLTHNFQRAGLAMAGGRLVIAFGGNNFDRTPYHGWVLTYNPDTLAQTGVFATSESVNGASVWQSGSAPAVDKSGNVYVLTGNGIGGGGNDGVKNFSETLLKFDAKRAPLTLADWFTPSNWPMLDTYDLDLSCNGPMVLSKNAAIVFSGKSAQIYVANPNQLGHVAAGDANLLQKFNAGTVSLGSPALPKSMVMGSSPALAAFNGRLYVASRVNSSGNQLQVASSTDGVNFTNPLTYTGIAMGGAPALAAFNGRLYAAFQSNDAFHTLSIASSADGVSFTAPARSLASVHIAGAPALAVFNGRLYVAFQADNPDHALSVISTADGVTFSPLRTYRSLGIGSSPGMAVLGKRLYIGFQANDSSNALSVTSSSNGVDFTTPAVGYANIAMGGSPSLTTFNNQLYVSYKSNDATDKATIAVSSDGVNFTPTASYAGILLHGSPATAAFDGQLYLALLANDPTNQLYVAQSSEDGNTQLESDGNRVIGMAMWTRPNPSSPSMLYAWPGYDRLVAFPLVNGRYDPTQERYGAIYGYGEPAQALSVSSNGDRPGSGIVWATQGANGRNVGTAGTLFAFHGDTLQMLWNSNQNAADTLGPLAKFVPPVVANGRVYMATDGGEIAVYGLK